MINHNIAKTLNKYLFKCIKTVRTQLGTKNFTIKEKVQCITIICTL